MTESIIELAPKIPVCEQGRELWALLKEAPRPKELADYITNWLDESLAGVELPEAQKLRLRVFGNVLLDLTRQGWLFAGEGEFGSAENLVLKATPPETIHRSASTGERPAPAEVKDTLRQALLVSRDEQRRDPIVRAFLRRMEQTRLYKGHRVNVRVLLASPGQLANDLLIALAAPEAARNEQLHNLVDPYLQLASELPDEHTGLRLLDIWRYCRYTWSLPLQTQPGRRMFYLVRDRKRPFHPIIGIAALGSAVVQISVRDHAIGWSLESLADKKDPKENKEHKQQRPARIEALRRELVQAMGEVYRADLIEDGVLMEAECEHPTTETLLRLADATDADYLGSRERRTQSTDLEAEARSPMFRKKRVKVLQEILSAKLEFDKCAELDGEETYQHLIQYTEGRRALRMALRSIKKRHVAASLMEITTCGAVPPYGELLGGKLVAMLMASPQVVEEYRARYDQFESVIASRMQGAELTRDANLVLLGTTSLYHVGSSQYNRVSFPGVGGSVNYKLLGKTEGYGSVHFSQKTYTTIQRLLHEESTTQSYTFAAGVNYKLRSMSAALSLLGLQRLQKHSTPRLVYAVPTAKNWREYLTGQDKQPQWYFNDAGSPAAETQKIIDYWKSRWFVNRVKRPETLARLQAEFRPESLLISTKPASSAQAEMAESLLFFLGPDKPPMISWTTFAEFDNGRLSFAEKQTVDESKTIHIKSKKLEDGIINLLKAGHRVYLTGNPGDGKTHLLRELEGNAEWPEGTYTESDASAVSEAQLVKGLQEAAQANRPALVAINEGPLRQMLHLLPDAEELAAQLASPFRYDNETSPTSAPKAVLVQLGSRQVLNKVLISEAVNLMLSRVDYSGAPAAVVANAKALGQVRVRERLRMLLDEVQRGGIHVTVHQLLGLLARMVTGGRNEAASAPPYYQSLFELPAESSPLAAELRDLDPANFTHAHLDTHWLWDAPTKAGPWLPGSAPATGAPGEIGISEQEAEHRFRQLKRQHFFEAEKGDQVMSALPDDRSKFNELLSGPPAAAVPPILKALVRFAGQAPENPVSLHLWTGMRYDSDQPAWARVAGSSLGVSDCAIKRPSLPVPMGDLLEYQPDHLLLTIVAKSAPEGPSLVIDLPLWRALNAVARGLPISSRDEDAGRRVDNFLAAAAAVLPSNSEYLRIFNSKDNIETRVQVVNNADAPAGASYLL